MDHKSAINIIGAGLSGLSAAIQLASQGIASRLISSLPSERAQSVLAEGGINASLDTMGQGDTVEEHFADTMKGGGWLEAESAVRALTSKAPDIVRDLIRLGVPFNCREGKPLLRYFGGQKKMRTAFARSSTGKMIMTALIDEVRKYEARGLVTRYPHHDLIGAAIKENRLESLRLRDHYRGGFMTLTGPAIICTGGLNGFFEGATTGTRQNTGHAAALLFEAGVEFADLEMIQYHPTTMKIPGKRMLISEAARGEGGRLWILRDGRPWYFMEEKYPELGNLMPRDVVSREMVRVKQEPGCRGPVYLDMTALPGQIWREKLSDLRDEIIGYLALDPALKPIPVEPGIHFFMGGIRVNDRHETNIQGLYAAGEAACKYHGANRLGGNSLLGAIYGGRVAAASASALECKGKQIDAFAGEVKEDSNKAGGSRNKLSEGRPGAEDSPSSAPLRIKVRDILLEGLGIIRNPAQMQVCLDRLEELAMGEKISRLDRARVHLSMAMLRSGLARRESRGAHYRIDYPDTDENYRKLTCVRYRPEGIQLRFIPADRQEERVI